MNTAKFRRATVVATVAGASAMAMVLGAPLANAASETGWTGATPPQQGKLFAHSSSISNNVGIVATTSIWNAIGTVNSAPYTLSVEARLFKSGVLCQSTGFVPNDTPTSHLSASTNGAGCGAGSYNSHGLVQTFDGSKDNTWVTFPTNPLDFAG
ncbi:hypothetical protein ACIGKR_31975 [Rhodococcus qingshengii]|uniref:hypothetical protein n=1 Tax=Rhodococcus qingshengii TaxID=334542 RepID=UPI0037C88406